MNKLANLKVLLDNKKYASNISPRFYTLEKELREFFSYNVDVKFDGIEEFCIPDDNYQAVGGMIIENKLYMIPANGHAVLIFDIDNKQYCYIGKLKDGALRYSGIGMYQDMIYGFPRTANSIIRINPRNNFVEEIKLRTEYQKEHHYSGVITTDGFLYMPPRNENHILIINLNTFTVKKLKIGDNVYRYSGIVRHPNGYIYIIPEYNQRVIKLDPVTNKIQFIGKFMKESRVLGPTISSDGNIYGFMGFSGGVLKIDVANDKVEVLCPEIYTGSLGTELATNGKLYSIPSYTNDVFEFDLNKNELRKVEKITQDTDKASCAGAAIAADGSIFCVPCHGKKIYKYKFDKMIVGGESYLRFAENNF